MKVNVFFELQMNESEIELLSILQIWEFWIVHFSSKGIVYIIHGIDGNLYKCKR